MSSRPSIVTIVGEYIQLRRAGKELTGLCPFHAEKTPSFAVNPDKEVFYCHGCHEGGDVVDFIRKLKGLSYREAFAELGVGMDPDRARPAPDTRLQSEARNLARWSNNMTVRAIALMRDIGKRAAVAKEAGLKEELEVIFREWEILEIIAEDLQSESHILQFYEQREDIEHLLANADVDFPEWPALLLEMFPDGRVPVLDSYE
jgi:hypothetical protein